MRFIITYTVPHHHLYGTASSFIRHRIITYTVPHHHLYGTASSLIRHRIIIYTVPHHHLNHTAPHLPSHRTTPLTTIPHTTQHPLHHIIKQTNHQWPVKNASRFRLSSSKLRFTFTSRLSFPLLPPFSSWPSSNDPSLQSLLLKIHYMGAKSISKLVLLMSITHSGSHFTISTITDNIK